MKKTPDPDKTSSSKEEKKLFNLWKREKAKENAKKIITALIEEFTNNMATSGIVAPQALCYIPPCKSEDFNPKKSK